MSISRAKGLRKAVLWWAMMKNKIKNGTQHRQVSFYAKVVFLKTTEKI
jgi:hypothetical protein